jgi:nucleotide-binding universal stress UspA family protein
VSAINHILCPIDFSDASAHAAEQAVAIARWSGATVTALHVEQPLFVPAPALSAPGDRVGGPRSSGVSEQARRFMAPAAIARVSTTVWVDVGDPVAIILESAMRLPADLIVMGTHGASGFQHLILGSVAEKVLRRAACPVLTVPPRAQTTSALPFRRILCGVDFSEWSAHALEFAGTLARQSGASLEVLHVIEWPWDEAVPPELPELPPAEAHALAEARRYLEVSASKRLETLVADEVPGGCEVVMRTPYGKPYAAILRTAVESHVDLIVLGVHGRRPIDIALFGSTTNHVVRRATCPVLTLRQ